MNSALPVSVVMPTYNRLDRLIKVLAGLEAQDFPKDQFEVIVVSDGSTDGTNEFLQTVKTDFQLVPVVQANQGPAAARNTGMACARGDLIIFVDDDVFPTPQLIAEHVRSHQAETQPAAVIGPMLRPADYTPSYWVRWGQDRLFEQYAEMQNKDWEPSARQFYTGNASFTRALFLQYGGFDTLFHRAEDVELAYRYHDFGVQFHFNPYAIGYHYEERSQESWMQIGYDYGRFDVVFALKKNQDWLLPVTLFEFTRRNIIIRTLVFLSAGRPKVGNAFVGLLRQIARLSDRLDWELLRRICCSCIFNIKYYQGYITELGGRRAFFSMVKTAVPKRSAAKQDGE